MSDWSEPVEAWMVRGGDHRLRIDEGTGLSRYRVAAAPRDTAAFGSCTGSSPSLRGMVAATEVLEGWRGASNADAAIADTADQVRARLRSLFELDATSTIALAPSGTDVVYLASALALAGTDHLHHVVVGASELGGGTMKASRGQFFSASPPFGAAEEGGPLAGLAEFCTAEPVYLRHQSGRRHTPDEVDEAVTERVEAAIARGERVILHLVAHSKTGLRAPSASCALRLRERHGDGLVVLVDAAQGRLAPHDVRQALAWGFLVLFTGSKFYSGPPFSGCLVIPERFSADPGALPEGLAAWLSAADLPRHWERARASLPSDHNPGMLIRWSAALAEIEAYHAIVPRQRSRVYHTFAGAVFETFGPSQVVEIDMPLPPVHRLVTGLGAYPSVFGFTVTGPDGYLGVDALKTLHELLDTDLSAEHMSLGGSYHLGQPVALGPPRQGAPAVLRVAMGSRLVTDLHSSPDAGAAWLRSQLGAVRTKIETLVALGRVG